MIAPLLILACISLASAEMAGGFYECDMDETQEVALRGVEVLNGMTDSLYHDTLVRVVEAKCQVVAGTLYHLKFYVAPTLCNKNEVDAKDVKEKCAVNEDGDAAKLCEVEIYDVPWENTFDLKKYNCAPASLAEAREA